MTTHRTQGPRPTCHNCPIGEQCTILNYLLTLVLISVIGNKSNNVYTTNINMAAWKFTNKPCVIVVTILECLKWITPGANWIRFLSVCTNIQTHTMYFRNQDVSSIFLTLILHANIFFKNSYSKILICSIE